ncbi:pirin family protein [Undibacterium arcticum]|uniref:Pirin family protein n=1 Tax=Undibacterium arcticum TaxID=1762892 RepID=A0ABV7EWB9_9BURK
MKKILGVHRAPSQHWVGDGFPVRTMFSYDTLGAQISPFLMLDFAGPTTFEPGSAAPPRGVGQHPHRGFETVTIVYKGEVEHRDSTGSGGRIGPGDVQWMTAASGILHEEFHSQALTRDGGELEMMQLWVNLPAKDKMAAPAYQSILDAQIPAVTLYDDQGQDAGRVRVIAGDFDDQRGPAHTFTPINVWDVRLQGAHGADFRVPEGHTAALIVMHGSVRVIGPDGAHSAGAAQLVLLDRAGDLVRVEADTDATILMLSGEPIDEPVVGYGPFVMNTQQEIRQAMQDFNSGRFGNIGA